MHKESAYIGAILAGGKGTRMGQFSDRYPKPLLPVANKPLIQYQIEMLRALGIVDILLLVGHKGFEISRVFGDGSALGVRIRYVEQTQTLGIAHAVGRFEPYVDRPILLFLGDIFFVPRDLSQMLRQFQAQERKGAVLAAKREADPQVIRKNFSMLLNARGLVQRVVEKPRHPPNNLKGVGLYLFDLTVFDAIGRTPRTALRDEYEITDSIQLMIDDGHPVSVCECIHDDINVTTPRDLLRCNLLQAAAANEQLIVGREVVLAPGVQLHHSVIGHHVAVQHPIAIRNSVVFDNTLVACTTDIEHAIVLPEGIVDCKHDVAQVRENP
jgi:dTDP-glucose pyrophosphorylase